MLTLATFLLAAISIEKLVTMLIVLVVLGLVFYVLWWGLNKIAPPEPIYKIAQVLIVLVAVVILVGMLLDLIGHPIVKW